MQFPGIVICLPDLSKAYSYGVRGAKSSGNGAPLIKRFTDVPLSFTVALLYAVTGCYVRY